MEIINEYNDAFKPLKGAEQYSKENYINIKWQEGTIPEAGVNGAQINDVIQVVLDRTIELNKLYPCRENEDTIMMLEQAMLHQNNSTRDRKVREVEGTYSE